MTPAPPRWIGTRGLACLTVGALACAIPGPFMDRETALAGWGVSAVMFGAAALGARAIVSFEGHSGVPYRRAVAIGGLYGAIAGFLALSLAFVAAPGPFRLDMVVIVGSTLGTLGGIAVMVAALPLTVAARDWRTARPLDTFERALGIDALVLALFGLPSAVLASLSGERGWDGVVASLLAAAGLGWLAVRDHTRRRWLARVAAGEAPGFALDDATPEDEALPPFVRAAPGPKVLTHASAAAPDGPFRAGPAAVTRIARVDPVRARWRLGLRAVLALLGAFILAAAQPPLAVLRAIHTNHTYLHEPTKPTPVPALDGVAVRDIAVGRGYACAVLPDASMRCWGNAAGTVLLSSFRPTREPEAKAGVDHVGAMALGDRRMCILHEPGVSAATCWGAGDFGELGVAGRALLPPLEIGPREVAELAVGDKFTLALTTEGKVFRWGIDPRQAFDYERPRVYPVEVAVVEGIPAAQHVAASRQHACAIDRAGAVWCWGDNSKGAATGVAPKKDPPFVDPTRVDGLSGPADRLVLGMQTSWARVRRADGRAEWWTWGERTVWGPEKTAEIVPTDTVPRAVPDTEHLEDVVLGNVHACGLFDDRSVACWGSFRYTSQHEPTTVLPPGSAEQLAGTDTNLCARGKSRVWCWAAPERFEGP